VVEMRNIPITTLKILKENTLYRPWSRWEDNIKIYLTEIGCEIVD
jgi:hypothetical protein